MGLMSTTIGVLLEQLADLDTHMTIYANEPWDCDSPAIVAQEGEAEASAAISSGMKYFLEVFLARDALETWSNWRGGRIPTREEMCDAVIHYAVHDAYLDL